MIRINLPISDKLLELRNRMEGYQSMDLSQGIDRDLNASINIKKEGIRILKEKIRQRLPESFDESQATLEDNPTMDDRLETNLKSSGWMIQEDVNLNV